MKIRGVDLGQIMIGWGMGEIIMVLALVFGLLLLLSAVISHIRESKYLTYKAWISQLLFCLEDIYGEVHEINDKIDKLIADRKELTTP